ncbi:MAG: hypothetical protein RL562_2824 [Planctomycetota bacterium]
MRVVFVLDPTTGPAGDPGPVLEFASRLPDRGIQAELFWFGDRVPPELPEETPYGSSPTRLPTADLLIATSSDTVEFAVAARRGPVVRLVTEAAPAPGRPVPTIVAGDTTRVAGVPRGEIHAIGLGVDTSTFTPQTGPRRPGPTRIGTLGWDAARGAAVVAALAGYEIQAEAVRIEDSCLVRTGRTRATLLRDCDVLVLAEGADRLAVEAMACGVPCILADTPATRGWLGDRSGAALLVDTSDPRSVTEAAVFLTRHQGLRRDVLEAGSATASNHACEPSTDDLAHALRRARERARETLTPTAATTAAERPCAIPASPLAWTRVAVERLVRGDAEGALRATDRALAAGGTSCRLLEVRARAFEALSRDEDALHVLDAASDHRDASPETFRELARHLRRCGEVARARIAESEAAVRAACG